MGERYDIPDPSKWEVHITDNASLIGNKSYAITGDNVSVWTGDTCTDTISTVDWGKYITVNPVSVSDYTITTTTGTYETFNLNCNENEGVLRTNRKRVTLKFS